MFAACVLSNTAAMSIWDGPHASRVRYAIADADEEADNRQRDNHRQEDRRKSPVHEGTLAVSILAGSILSALILSVFNLTTRTAHFL